MNTTYDRVSSSKRRRRTCHLCAASSPLAASALAASSRSAALFPVLEYQIDRDLILHPSMDGPPTVAAAMASVSALPDADRLLLTPEMPTAATRELPPAPDAPPTTCKLDDTPALEVSRADDAPTPDTCPPPPPPPAPLAPPVVLLLALLADPRLV